MEGGEGVKKMSAIEMVRLCETADDWIAMICKQCKIRRPSKASYWFNVCEAVFESLKIRPLRNCDRPECATTKSAQEVWRKEDGGKTAYYEWLLAKSRKDLRNEQQIARQGDGGREANL